MGLLSSLGTARAGSVVRAAAQTSIKMEADDEAMINSSGTCPVAVVAQATALV